MATGVGVELYADGVRVADGSGVVDPSAPIALSGLAVAWGRSTTVDQPEPSTCTFELADLPGGPAFSDLLTIGTSVRVNAVGTTYPDPTVSTFPDPGFESAAPITTALANATVVRSSRRAMSGTQAARVRPTTSGAGASAIFAPAAFVPAGTSPDAWDAIPATALGQRWTITVAVFAPTGATVSVRAAMFSGPYSTAWRLVGNPVSRPGDGAWHDVTVPVVPDVAGSWIGAQIAVWPPGRSWDEVPGTWDAQPVGWTWDDERDVYVDDVRVLAPAGGVASSVLVYAGRVTDLQTAFDEGIPSPVIQVTCADFTADLDNVDVGDEPWLLEPMGTRFNRILTLAALPVTATIDASVSSIPVSWRDVDRQPAAGLLADVATSVDAVMWSAVHAVSGPYLRVEDPANRPPPQVFALVGGVVVIVDSSLSALALSACDALEDPMSWHKNVGDVSTRVSVTWQLQGTDPDDGSPTVEDQTYLLVDSAREGYGPGKFGTRRYGVSTELTTSADAALVARRILARTQLAWRADGLTIDDALPATDAGTGTDTARILALLDGTSRIGLLLRLTDLPAWAPDTPSVGVYVEGGQYSFEDGRWLLALNVSNAANQGRSATWDELPTPWTWDQFASTITWDDLPGVGAPLATAEATEVGQ